MCKQGSLALPFYLSRLWTGTLRQRSQSGLNSGDLGCGFENWGGSWVLKIQQTESRSRGVGLWSPEFLFKIHNSLYFWKIITLESVLISYSCTLLDIMIFNGDQSTPKTPISKSGVAVPQIPQDWRLRCQWRCSVRVYMLRKSDRDGS